jgi:hypothetical protein
MHLSQDTLLHFPLLEIYPMTLRQDYYLTSFPEVNAGPYNHVSYGFRMRTGTDRMGVVTIYSTVTSSEE